MRQAAPFWLWIQRQGHAHCGRQNCKSEWNLCDCHDDDNNDDNYYGNSKATKWNKWVFASCFSILCLLCILLHPAWVHVTSSKPQSQALHPLVMWSDRSLSSPSHLQWSLQHLTCSSQIIWSLFLSTSN